MLRLEAVKGDRSHVREAGDSLQQCGGERLFFLRRAASELPAKLPGIFSGSSGVAAGIMKSQFLNQTVQKPDPKLSFGLKTSIENQPKTLPNVGNGHSATAFGRRRPLLH